MGSELGTRNRNANTECRMGRRRKGDDIADRLLDLGAAVLKLLPAIGKKPGGKAIVKQLESKWTESRHLGTWTESTEIHEHGLSRARAE